MSGSVIRLYAVSTTGTAGTATSLLNTPGFVLTGLDGSFSISGDYSCPANSYVYIVASGGNPGLSVTPGNNAAIGLIAGLGACSSLSASTYLTINEITTVEFAYALSAYTASETQVGSDVTTDHGIGAAFNNISAYVNPTDGRTLPDNPNNTAVTMPQERINSLANSIAACVNSSGTGAPCSTLFAAANVTGATMDTAQAAINISHNPGTNVAAIYALGPPNAVFQPTLSAAPATWALAFPPAPLSSFFNGQVALGNGVYYLAFPNGNYFGYYSYLTNNNYIYHNDLGYELVTDAADGQSGIYLYDYKSGHTWYTSPTYPFPYLYDYTLQAQLYYYPDPNNAGHYNTNGVRYFYNFATGQIITL